MEEEIKECTDEYGAFNLRNSINNFHLWDAIRAFDHIKERLNSDNLTKILNGSPFTALICADMETITILIERIKLECTSLYRFQEMELKI